MADAKAKRKLKIVIVAVALIVVLSGIVILIGSLCRVRFLDKHTTGGILKQEDESVEAVIFTSVYNGSFHEKTITFEVGGGEEYQNGYLKNDRYDNVQIEIQKGTAQVNAQGDCITIPRGEKVILQITVQNEYIGSEYKGEQVYLKREAPEDVRIVIVD